MYHVVRMGEQLFFFFSSRGPTAAAGGPHDAAARHAQRLERLVRPRHGRLVGVQHDGQLAVRLVHLHKSMRYRNNIIAGQTFGCFTVKILIRCKSGKGQ